MNLEEIKKEISRAEKSLNSAKILASIQDDRFRADYDVVYLAAEEDVKESLKIAGDFLNAVKAY